MKDSVIIEKLEALYNNSKTVPFSNKDRIIIFSDLHLGNGGRKDDFLYNSSLIHAVLEKYYLVNGYTLILNGDIEELHRFSLKSIQNKWTSFYNLLEGFSKKNRLFKIYGNHDYKLLLNNDKKPIPSLRLFNNDQEIFIFHGHQASYLCEKWNYVSGLILRLIANPLGIKSYSVSHNSLKKYRTEKRVYKYSNKKKLISIIGHTHRPLFESLSKIDSHRYKIENLLRKYQKSSSPEMKQRIEKKILFQKRELLDIPKRERKIHSTSSIYNSDIIVPSLFNSGCGIGKSGITGLEIRDGKIALVHWFDSQRSNKHCYSGGAILEPLKDTKIIRKILKEDDLEYIFTRIRLLA